MRNFYLAVFGLFSIGAFAQNSNPWPITGNVGIGTNAPSYPLEIYRSGTSLPAGTYDHARIGSFISTIALPPVVLRDYGLYISENSSGMLLQTKTGKPATTQSFISLLDQESTTTSTGAVSIGYGSNTFFSVIKDGRVRISSTSTSITMPTGYRLYVEEGILTEKVKVAIKGTTNWADYVFADDYTLMPLEEVEQFTKENKHLPNVPCAEDMVTEGLDVAKMDAKLLEKIEELTLYLIEQNKKLEEQNKKIEILENELQQIKKQQN